MQCGSEVIFAVEMGMHKLEKDAVKTWMSTIFNYFAQWMCAPNVQGTKILGKSCDTTADELMEAFYFTSH